MKLDQAHQVRSFRARLAAVSLIALFALGLAAGSAQACSYPGASPAFAPWGDQHDYALAPEGGFESGGNGWTLRGGAAVVAGNESYQLNGPSDSRSLALPAGSTAVSPPVCMSIDTPLIRLLARNTGNPSSRLRVEAVYSLLGLVRTNLVNTISVGASWEPSKQMSTVLGLSTIVGTILPSAIEVRLTPLDSTGQWQVDDLYVDPFARH
ncbi:MAG TPA: hypothetical protein VKH20_06735 [Solirubrobacterales bacterium]|nr:hypothetical protein [Solirubrobacterales bacterium]